MTALRLLLVVLFVGIALYTAVVVAHHGLALLPIFVADIAAMTWPGQFNVDFLSFLTLSATWLAWRHHFTPVGLVLAVLGFFGGGLFLSAYLLVMSWRANGSIPVLLLGPRRVPMV